MHACGHDLRIAYLLATMQLLKYALSCWNGTRHRCVPARMKRVEAPKPCRTTDSTRRFPFPTLFSFKISTINPQAQCPAACVQLQLRLSFASGSDHKSLCYLNTPWKPFDEVRSFIELHLEDARLRIGGVPRVVCAAARIQILLVLKP